VCTFPEAPLQLLWPMLPSLLWIPWPESLAFKAKASPKMKLSSRHLSNCACDLFC
jgi:hypothetical protein